MIVANSGVENSDGSFELWAVGSSGSNAAIYHSSDGGSTWGSLNSHYQYDNYHSSFAQDENNLHIGGDGSYYISTDGGTSWEYQDINNMNSVNGIFFPDQNKGFIVGQNGNVNVTDNGGETWNSKNIQTSGSAAYLNKITVSEDLNSVFFMDSDNGIIVGDNGTLLLTSDGGETWSVEYAGTTENLIDVFSNDEGIVFICGENGTVITNNEITHVAKYQLNTTVNSDEAENAGCSITVDPTNTEFDEGTTVILTAVSTEGWEFVE
ncbi:MAG: YCF48-related protein [Ignavibacteria bacterium]|jgi:photosystem II stability/assembly factor-like uncharacterized protein